MSERGRRPPFRHLVAGAWATLVVAYLTTIAATGSGPLEILGAIARLLVDHPLGPLLYVLACFVRPLFLFSSSLLTIGAGHLYGPLLGFVVVVVGHQSGALLAYHLARWFGGELAERAFAHPRLRGATARLRRNAFEAVLTLRLVFTPFDAVNYAAGALRLPRGAFVAGSVLGSLAGGLTFLLFGASIGDLTVLEEGRLPTVDPLTLAASAALLVVSLLASRALRRRAPADARAA